MPDDPVFLITGASSGIGAATARAAAADGYRVVLAARSEDKLADLAAELGGGNRALVVRCDVTEWDDQEAMVRATLNDFGRLDVVMANAGFGAKRGFTEETPEFWKSMVLTNVYGAALTIRATIDALRESEGHLLLTGSVAGRRALPGSLYSATKWAVTAMGEAARQELNGTGVRVTLIEPGMVDTPFFENRPGSGALEADDIARAVMYAIGATAPRRRQRDPRAPGGAGELTPELARARTPGRRAATCRSGTRTLPKGEVHFCTSWMRERLFASRADARSRICRRRPAGLPRCSLL